MERSRCRTGVRPTRGAVWVAALAGVALGSSALAANKASVELLSSTTALVPGQPVDVALKFKVTDGWHLYWKGAGDSGLPPTAKWRLPDGFTIGEFRFPVPKRHSTANGLLITNILEGEPVLLATLTPAANASPSDGVTIAADVQWLVCDKSCLTERGTVSLKLPVVKDAAQAKPANAELFDRARKRLPVANDQAKYVKVTPRLADGKLGRGSKFEIRIDVLVKEGHHIQANEPLSAGLIPTEIFVGPADGVFFDRPAYPQPKLKTVPTGKQAEYAGTIAIKLTGEGSDELAGDSRSVEGLFVYQACKDDSGTCFPREAVEWSLKIPIALAAADVPAPERLADGNVAPQTVPPETKTSASDSAPPVVTGSVPPSSGPTGSGTGLSTPSPSGGPAGLEATSTAPTSDGGSSLEHFLKRLGLGGLLVGCFLYGLFVNATPCVLPLLSIKVLGFVQQAHESKKRTFALALAFGIGVIAFWVLLGFLAGTGTNILQYPAVIITLGAVITALALSMLGVYILQAPSAAANLDATLHHRESVGASFAKGALAPVLGFACTGPLMAGAFGWATKQPPLIALVSFILAGLGMASPYILLGANPHWLKFVPKPGPWMITFERIMGFLLLGMVIWLLHPLITQIGAEGLEWTLGFLVFVAMGCWVLGKVDYGTSTPQRWRCRGAAAGLVALSAALIYGWIYPLSDAQAHQRSLRESRYASAAGDWSREVPWRAWSPESVRDTVASGKMVFVDFTAAYCTQCKANKLLAINIPDVRKKMQELSVVPYQADFTDGDPRIYEVLQRHDRAGVPLNLIYLPGRPDQPLVLPPALTGAFVLEKLAEAARGAALAAAHPPTR